MNKTEIRKKILKARKQNISNNLVINFKYIIEILIKNKGYKKIVGGYYPYNYEVNPIEILNVELFIFLILNMIKDVKIVINNRYIGKAAIFNRCKFKSVIE